MKVLSPWKYINKGLAAILGVLVLATIGSIVFLGYTLRQLDGLIAKSGSSVQSAQLLQDLTLDISNASNNARGYVLNGDSASLDGYHQSSGRVTADLRQLATNPDFNLPKANMKQLRLLSAQRFDLLEREVQTRTAGDLETANALLSGEEGSKLMADIRDVLMAISSSNKNDTRSRQQQSHSYLDRALWVAIAVLVLVLAICGALARYFQHTVLRERALENTKSEFLSLASHQLRTPATNVKQYLGMLMEGYLGKITGKQRDALSIAYTNNESEIRIMNDLLDVAKLDLERTHLHKQRVNIVAMVRQVMKDSAPYAASHHQTQTLKAPRQLMASVDPTYFRSVLEKLVDNALRYSHDHTRIAVSIHNDRPHGCFEIIVKDQGVGIKRREITKLFMKFSRLDNEFSANTEGSGMGLYWVKQIVALHGGDIKVISREGSGSEFSIRASLV